MTRAEVENTKIQSLGIVGKVAPQDFVLQRPKILSRGLYGNYLPKMQQR